MPEQLWFTAILNKLFGGVVNALLVALGIHPEHPQAPIPNYVAMQVLVAILLVLTFLLVRSRLDVEKPGWLQHVTEGLYGFIKSQSAEVIGHENQAYLPFLSALFVYILACNLLGVVPGFESPTATPSVPLGCAVTAFLYYNLQGIKKHGVVHYAKQFAGPLPILAPLMVPIELVSNFARMLSLTVRLFANMFAGDLVTLVFFSLIPIGVPVVFLGLHIGVSLLQAYIFFLLTSVYISGAVAEGH
jgi:F-type H+-transporting ATPase subunit a